MSNINNILISFSFLLIIQSTTPFFLLYAQEANQPEVTVKTIPEQPLIAGVKSNQYLSFDFLIENKSAENLRLESITINVYDADNHFVKRKKIDQWAVNPSINTIPNRELNSNSRLILFNPFYSFHHEISLHTLEYEFRFSNPKTNELTTSKIIIQPEEFVNQTELIVPLRGRVLVESGFDFFSHHRRIDISNEALKPFDLIDNPNRFALDLTLSDIEGKTHRGNGDNLTDWYGYGAIVYAPSEGVVIKKVDGISDNTIENGRVIFSNSFDFTDLNSFLGNYLILDHKNGEYSLFAHLKSGSFRAEKGEMVKKGEEIAQVGFSGNTLTVHLHYQLQTGIDISRTETLPIYFNNYKWLLGTKNVVIQKGAIDTGDIIKPLQTSVK
jgi:hypothetical protein